MKHIVAIAISCIGLLLCGGRVDAFPLQKIIPPGDWVYEALALLALETQQILYAENNLTVSQAGQLLQSINEEDLSPGGKILLSRVQAYLESPAWISIEEDAMTFDFDLALAPEFYYKTEEGIPWISDYHRRLPMLSSVISFSLSRYLTLEFDPYIGQNEKAAMEHDNYTNILYDPVGQFDMHFPKWAYLSMGLPFGKASGVHFAVGIGNNFMARTQTGSIILSDYMERTSYASLSVYSPLLKWTSEVKELDPLKYQYMHYFSFSPLDVLSVTLVEGVMVNAPLELRFLNPMMIFHSLESFKTYDDYNADLANNPESNNKIEPSDASRVGSFFGAKLEITPVKNVRLYGIYAMNQLQFPTEHEKWEDSLGPDAMAWQAGTEVSIPVTSGYWKMGLEGVYTFPFMYIMYNKGWSYYKEVYEVDNMTLRYWTGSPFGPDSIAYIFWLGYFNTTKSALTRSLSHWSLEFSLLWLAQGEKSSLSIFDSAPLYAPSDVNKRRPLTGTATYTWTAAIEAKWAPANWVQLALRPGYRYIKNNGHVSGQTDQGFEVAFSALFRPLP
ncbi:hypothetical protein ACYULU_06925 [Breznakiellaceae bacterium SP9]